MAATAQVRGRRAKNFHFRPPAQKPPIPGSGRSFEIQINDLHISGIPLLKQMSQMLQANQQRRLRMAARVTRAGSSTNRNFNAARIRRTASHLQKERSVSCPNSMEKSPSSPAVQAELVWRRRKNSSTKALTSSSWDAARASSTRRKPPSV